MFKFIVQLMVTLAVAAGVALLTGARLYLGFSVLVFVVSFLTIIGNEQAYAPGLKLPAPRRTALDTISMLGISLYVGMVWPSLPIIVWRQSVTERDREASSERTS